MKRAFFIFAALILVTMGAGCLKVGQKAPPPATTGNSAIDKLPFQELDRAVTVSAEPSEAPKDLDVPAEQPSVKPGETASYSQNVIVSSIVKNQTLANPFIILGRARSFENVIGWRVRDARGSEVAKGTALTNAPDAGRFGTFRVRAFYGRIPETANGTVEVYTLSPRDGTEQDVVAIPVRFEPKVTAVKAFFSNIKEDPQTLNCAKVFPATRRVPLTENVAEVAIIELLKGPTVAEQSLGFRTSIFPGAALRSIAVNGETASVDFTKEFFYAVAGSCHVQALRAQVTETLKQFPAIKNVKFLVEGADAEDKLQP